MNWFVGVPLPLFLIGALFVWLWRLLCVLVRVLFSLACFFAAALEPPIRRAWARYRSPPAAPGRLRRGRSNVVRFPLVKR
jgi:hypothetical protein